MRLLVVAEHPGIGSLLPALRLLVERGHDVHVAFEEVRSPESMRELEELARECPGLTVGDLPEAEGSWSALARQLRSGIDYLRYLEPRYREAAALRARARRKAPPFLRGIGDVAARGGPSGVRMAKRALEAVERSLEPPPAVTSYLRERRPDVLCPLHLLPIGTAHADYLRAARRQGIRSVFPVRGWDNLTNKGLLRDSPDLVLVWNALQAEEAAELHGVPRERIRLTGAPSVDHWFDWRPSRARADFCREVGLRADRPIVLYVCSSGFVAPDEVGFVRGWIDGLRARGGRWAEVGFLVRPHPLNAAQWADAELDGPQVRVWPRFGEDPGDEAARRNYFDSIHHAAAVVGINTTAQIEGAIVGRPVHTLLAEEFRDTQQGTLHFQHLRGHVYEARTPAEHAAQLEESLDGRDDEERNAAFLERFVRPNGLDRQATIEVVEAIEALAARPAPRAEREPATAALVRLALRPIAARAARQEAARRARPAAQATPVRELRRAVRSLVRDRSGVPVVAGPWRDDEVGELLCWIPHLRWAQEQSSRLGERLFVVSRASSAAWYDGIGAGRVDAEELEGGDRGIAAAFGFGSRAFRRIDASAVARVRGELAAGSDWPVLHAPLQVPDPPTGLDLPDDALVARIDGVPSAVAEAALGAGRPVVHVRALAGAGRAGETAAIAHAAGYVGTSSADAAIALLAGVPALLLVAEHREAEELAGHARQLDGPRYGRLRVVAVGASPAEVTRASVELFQPALQRAGTAGGQSRR
ncbi:MAG TPA: hypothetical protein VH760_02275 [Gaiellaceae bacterium]